MSAPERDRWNRKWADPAFRGAHAPNPRLAAAAATLPPGLALDLACGLGENAALVARLGHRVVGLDQSEVGIARARVGNPGLLFVQADALHLPFGARCWDFVYCTYFLERALFARFRTAVRPGGAVYYETFTQAMLRRRPDFPPGFCLRPGELRAAFAAWRILRYEEDPAAEFPFAAILARAE